MPDNVTVVPETKEFCPGLVIAIGVESVVGGGVGAEVGLGVIDGGGVVDGAGASDAGGPGGWEVDGAVGGVVVDSSLSALGGTNLPGSMESGSAGIVDGELDGDGVTVGVDVTEGADVVSGVDTVSKAELIAGSAAAAAPPVPRPRLDVPATIKSPRSGTATADFHRRRSAKSAIPPRRNDRRGELNTGLRTS
ncbi:MAG TPA: hypothetical protein VGP24_09400 [Glaciihabitans sp.]|nr:hypothetical protein [Glaciihabitans sp.]